MRNVLSIFLLATGLYTFHVALGQTDATLMGAAVIMGLAQVSASVLILVGADR